MSLLTTVDRRGADAGVAHALQVTPDNFARAESDMQFMTVVKRGGFGRLTHERDFPPAGRQSRPWADGDVLRSRAVFDLELGPVTVTVPDAGERFVSLEALDEDHYTVAMFYGPGTYTFSFDNVSTRYVLIVVRIMVDPANRADLARVHELQETIMVSRQGGGRFVIPNWDPVSQAKVRVALQLLANTVSGDDRTFGAREEVDPVRHLIGTATQWDRCPPRDIAYLHACAAQERRPHHPSAQRRPCAGGRLLVAERLRQQWAFSEREPRRTHGQQPDRATRRRRFRRRAVRRLRTGASTIACRSPRAGATWCGSIDRAPKILGGKWKFPDAQPLFDAGRCRQLVNATAALRAAACPSRRTESRRRSA